MPTPDGRSRVRSIAIDLSGRCNLACRYCAESATQPTRAPMSLELLERAWDWFCRESEGSASSVHVGSGEPFLAWPLLKRLDALVRAASTDRQSTPVFLTTNGTLIDRDLTDWLAATGWYVRVSLDGPKRIHDRWRVTRGGNGTFDLVSSRVADLAHRLGDRFAVNAVYCRDTDPAEVHRAVGALGVRQMQFIPVASNDPAVRPGGPDLRRYAEFMADHARRWVEGDGGPEPALIRFSDYVVRVMGYHNRGVECEAARSYVGIGPDGMLYPCMRFVGIDRYRIGNLQTGLDPETVLAFQRGPGRPYTERDSCRSCWAAPMCCGPCFACAEMFDLGHNCAMYQADAHAAVWLVRALRERDPERLLSFLG